MVKHKTEHKKTAKNSSPKEEKCDEDAQSLFDLFIGYAFYGALATFIVSFFVAPMIGKLVPGIMVEIVFLHRLYWPPFANFSDPAYFNLPNTRSFKLTVEDGVDIGVWQVTPDHLIDTPHVDQVLKDGQEKVVLYLHGNTGSRATPHRVELYKLLARMGFHVFAFDYRGYADSTGYPSQSGVLSDSLALYHYIRLIAPRAKIVVWGHSLGSGVSTLLAADLCHHKNNPAALILECPFTNIIEAAEKHPLSKYIDFLPWFPWVVHQGLEENNISFPSDKMIKYVTVPILILHTEDDFIIPFELGQKLYSIAKESRSESEVQFVGIPATEGLGHKYACRSKNLPNVLRDFLKL